MGKGQSKLCIKTKKSQRKDKGVKRRIKKEKVELSEAAQLFIGSDLHGGDDPQPPTSAVVETEKKAPTVSDTLEPHEPTAITAARALPLSKPNEATDRAKSDSNTKTKRTQKDLESCLESAQPTPVQPVDISRQSEATTIPTPTATGTESGGHCEEQAVGEVEDKKLSTVAVGTTKLFHSGISVASKTVITEDPREDKKCEGASEDGLTGPRARDKSDHVSKKHVRKTRHKPTRRHALTADNVLRELKDVSWETLSKGKTLTDGEYYTDGILGFPSSQRHKVEAKYTTEDQQKNAAVRFWLNSHPYASWRKLITQMDRYEEHSVAKQIHCYAEKLTDPTLTHANITAVTATVPLENNELGKLILGVPTSKCIEIKSQSSTAAKEREKLIHYYLNYSPYASWSHLAGRLYRAQRHDALSAVRKFIKKEPDPTLTLPNLTTLIEKMDWNDVGLWIDIPDATRHMIHANVGDDSQCRLKCWEVYLSEHPSPSWKQVAQELYRRDRLEELEVVQKKYLKGTAENQRQFEEAMKHGHVKAWLCKLLMYGVAGSGKTTSKEIIVGNKPPKHRESTPLATRPTTIYRVNLESEEWAKLTTLNDRKLFLARALIRDAPMLVDRLLANRSSEASVNISPVPVEAKPPVKLKDPVVSGLSDPPLLGTPQLDAENGSDKSSESISSDEEIEAEADTILKSISTDEQLVKLMDQLSANVDPLTAFRILEMIDCGGQPQFHEILPIFLRHLDFYIFVFRLCDELGSRPLIEFYVDGKPVGTPFESSQTIEQLLQHCARSMHTHKSSEGECPKIMVLGTHADLEGNSKETREQKNKRILKLLLPNLEKQIIYLNVSKKQVIFPLNALNPGPEEERIIDMIRNILLGGSSVPAADIPLRWFAFEIHLEEMTKALHRGVLRREECLTTAMDKLHFDDDEAEFDSALQYLHKLSVLFYYHDILPAMIFADPQVIYDKVSELVLAHYRMSTDAGVKASTDEWCKFYEFALVTAEFLSQSEFSKHYVPGLFEPEHLIDLFKKLLVFATFHEVQYFVPALLHELSNKDVDIYRIHSAALPSLALEFPDGGPRRGIFCSLLCWLVSLENEYPAPLCISTDQMGAPVCLYRNCIQLDIPKSPATVILIDAYTHFEVHIKVPERHAENLCPKLLPSIRKAIFKGIHKATLNLHYSISTPSAALVCPCGKGDAHIASINKDIGFWTCSLDKMECDELSSLQLLWVDSDPSDLPCNFPDTQQLMEVPHLAMLLRKLNDHAWQWRDIGSCLGFRQGELNNIQASVQRHDIPVGCLRTMLSQWLQWAPGDSRGSTSSATLKAMKTALHSCGLGATASCFLLD